MVHEPFPPNTRNTVSYAISHTRSREQKLFLVTISSHRRYLSSSEGRVQGTNLDVGVSDGGVRVGGLDSLGKAGLGVTATTEDTGLGGVSLRGVGAVEPVHGDCVVVPHAENEDHLLQGLAHSGHAAQGGEVVVVAEGGLLLLAEAVVDVADGVDALNLD